VSLKEFGDGDRESRHCSRDLQYSSKQAVNAGSIVLYHATVTVIMLDKALKTITVSQTTSQNYLNFDVKGLYLELTIWKIYPNPFLVY
jgi:hypothetical protein